jgi:hypothetical protein
VPFRRTIDLSISSVKVPLLPFRVKFPGGLGIMSSTREALTRDAKMRRRRGKERKKIKEKKIHTYTHV